MEERQLRGTQHRALLVCGIVSSLLYGVMIGTIRFEGYSLVSQVPSELTAIGAPTRTLWMWLGAAYTVLLAAFGWGVWESAGRNRVVRIVGGLMLAYGSLGLLWPFAAMHQREVLAAGGGTWSDTMHVVLAGVTVLLMFLVMGFGATAFGKRFRLYSIISGVVLMTFGALTFVEAPRPRIRFTHAVDWAVGAHQHRRVPDVGGSAGDRADANRNSPIFVQNS